MFLKNILTLLKNNITFINFIIKKLKNKNIIFMVIYILINIFILPNITLCDSDTTNNDINVDDCQENENDFEKEKEFLKKILIAICFITVITLTIIYFLPDGENFDSSSESDLDEIIPKKPVEYIPARGYDFFVQDMGIIYDSDIEPEVNKDN